MVVANVDIWGKFVGAVLWDQQSGIASFEYNPAFLRNKWDIAPLSMPLSEASNGKIFRFSDLPAKTYYGLPGLLADSLPDRFGNQLIDLWLATQGREPGSMNPVERLCYMGKRGMGALEFRPATRIEKGDSNILEVSELVNLAQSAVNRKSDLTTNLSNDEAHALLDIIRVGTSAGGARAKAVIAINKHNTIRSGQMDVPEGYSHWLIKLDGVSDEQLGEPKGYGRIEFAYYKMALDCGIIMSESRLLEENGRAHFMIRRFDRLEHNKKLHIQTLCGLCHFDYNNPNAYSYEQAFQAMRSLRLPYSAADQLFRRMVFNVIGSNNDDHTKNISFLMDETGQWSLSPAYDVTFAYNPSNLWLSQHQLSINNKRRDITRNDLLSLATRMNVKKAKEIIENARDVISKWKEYASDSGIAGSQIKAIGATHQVSI
ncbi:MAG: type II toxin-antitoxin system HipA family toxin [Bacteroidota bacterium]